MRHARSAAFVVAAASLALAAGDRDAATVDDHALSFTFPSGKWTDYAVATTSVREKLVLANGALVVSGAATKAGATASIAIPNVQAGPFTADVVVDLTGAGSRSDADPASVFFGVEYGAAVVRGIAVNVAGNEFDAFVGDGTNALGQTVRFSRGPLALHFERTATTVLFEASPVGSARTAIGAVANSFAPNDESSLVLSIRGLHKGESCSLDDLALAGSVNANTGIYCVRLRTVLGIERNARTAASAAHASEASIDLDDASSVLVTQIADATTDKGGAPPALKKALSAGVSKMKSALKLCAKAKKVVAAGKDASAMVDAAIDATLAAGHVIRGMSVAEPWDPGP